MPQFISKFGDKVKNKYVRKRTINKVMSECTICIEDIYIHIHGIYETHCMHYFH